MLRTLSRGVASASSSASKRKQVCIVGSGPAGFYCAQHLVKVFKEDEIQVDIYEKLPVPFGLVRYGVAPDHPDVKNVINSFTKTAQRVNVEFMGNVTLGQDVSLDDLSQAYHAIVLAYGCAEDNNLGIPGEDRPHVYSARSLVAWYNGSPEERDVKPDLSHDTALVVGQGNVGIDVARILLSPLDLLRKTDIPEGVLAELSESKVKRVYLVGRRGPLQAAFTIKEFREMTKLPQVSVSFPQHHLMQQLTPYLQDMGRARKRLTDLMIETSRRNPPPDSPSQPKTFLPLFYRKPLTIDPTTVTFSCTSAHNLLEGSVEDTGEIEKIEAGLVVKSIGYRGVCVDPQLPFSPQSGTVVSRPGLYGVGWIGNGATGVILQTMNSSFKQAQLIADHMISSAVDTSTDKPGSSHILQILRSKGVEAVRFGDWEKMDRVEKRRGELLGKPREKILSIHEMLQIARS